MGYFFGRAGLVSPTVTRQEYLGAVDQAFEALSGEKRRGIEDDALGDLVAGRPLCAIRAFSSLLARRPDDATLHRLIGMSYSCAGNARLAACHLEIALMLLTRATACRTSLLRSLRIELEASVVRLALMAAYRRLGHRAGVAGCLLAQNRPLAWDIHPAGSPGRGSGYSIWYRRSL